jgi:hypothetical protein
MTNAAHAVETSMRVSDEVMIEVSGLPG